MDPISQQADSLIREGDPSNPRPDNDVKPSSADAVANPDAPSKPKDASKPRDTKRKSAKKQAKGSKAKKDKKKKKKKRAAINDSSDSSSTSSDDDSTELDSDSDSADDEVVVRRRRTNKKREEAPKLKTVGNTKKHKGHVKSKLKPTAGSDLDSDSSHTGWASSSDDVEESEPILDPPKKTKDHDLKQDVGFQVARELQRLLQLAQTHAPPPPGLSSHAALGSAFDSGLGPGLLPNSGNAFPRSAAIGGLPATYSSMAGGRARPAYDDRLALLDGLGDPLGRDGGLSNRRARHGGLGADKKLPGSATDPQKQKSKKYDFKRVDQVWDNSIHNFKLQDTAESAADKKYDGFCFHVRRTFDWEGKYKATVVDVKSKALRECLQDVIGNIKGVSLVDETPKLDPNVLFLYLEDLRKHAKHLRKQVKSPTATDKQERKKEAKWLEEKRLHLKVLVKYIDKDYEHVKKSLYPMLEHGLITFDLLWALWKPGTLAYTTTYGSHDEPRVFKVDTAEKHYHISKGEFYYVDGKVSAKLWCT